MALTLFLQLSALASFAVLLVVCQNFKKRLYLITIITIIIIAVITYYMAITKCDNGTFIITLNTTVGVLLSLPQ